MSFPRYPTYRDSGVEWLGEVPGHWEVRALKRLASMRSGESITAERIAESGDYPVLGGNGLRGYTTDFTHDGCFPIVGRQGALCGNVNYSSGKFWASEHAVVVTPSRDVDTHWLGEMLRAMDLNQYSTSAAQPGLSVEMIGNLRTGLPPLREQQTIASFVDRESAAIDRLITEQKRLIELLTAKRQAVISHAVTKGLNPDARMKPSGVEWLGEIPAHWRSLPLSRVTTDRCDGPFGSGLKSDHYSDHGVRVIRLQNIRAGRFDDRDAAYVDPDYVQRELLGHDVVAGDLLIAGLGDDNHPVGRACVAPASIEPAMVKADCFRFRTDHADVSPEFLAAQLTAGALADGGLLASGTTRSRIPLSIMATRRLALPPFAEQNEIVAHLQEQEARFAGLIADTQRAILLLHERRSALISAAVTGKIDVRGLTDAAA